MSLTPVGNPTGWLSILQRMGITQFGRWLLSDTISPVAIVDSSVVLTSTSVPALFGAPASAGELVAPIANTRLADTGALTAGNWTINVYCGNDEAGGAWVRVKRRNAADAADVWSVRLVAAGGLAQVFVGRFQLLTNERIVVENPVAGTALKVYQGVIFAVSS